MDHQKYQVGIRRVKRVLFLSEDDTTVEIAYGRSKSKDVPKKGHIYCYYDTWEEAHKHLVEIAEAEIVRAQHLLRGCEEWLKTAQQMAEEEVTI